MKYFIQIIITLLFIGCSHQNYESSGMSNEPGESSMYMRGEMKWDSDTEKYVRNGEWLQICVAYEELLEPVYIYTYNQGKETGYFYSKEGFGNLKDGIHDGLQARVYDEDVHLVNLIINKKRIGSVSRRKFTDIDEYYKELGKTLEHYILAKHQNNVKLIDQTLTDQEKENLKPFSWYEQKVDEERSVNKKK
jgi:hypothetical protein